MRGDLERGKHKKERKTKVNKLKQITKEESTYKIED